MQGSNLRLLACEASLMTSRSFVNLRYHAGIIRIATIAIFSQFETSRTPAKKFCQELSRIGAIARWQHIAIDYFNSRLALDRNAAVRMIRHVNREIQDKTGSSRNQPSLAKDGHSAVLFPGGSERCHRSRWCWPVPSQFRGETFCSKRPRRGCRKRTRFSAARPAGGWEFVRASSKDRRFY